MPLVAVAQHQTFLEVGVDKVYPVCIAYNNTHVQWYLSASWNVQVASYCRPEM